MKKKRLPLLIGRKIVLEALEEGRSFEKIFYQAGLNDDVLKEVLKLAKHQEIPVSKVPVQKLDRFSRGNHQGLVAITSEIRYQRIEDLIPHFYEQGITPLIVILDGVTDVRNFGGIARSAEVMGAHAIVMPLKNSAPANAEAIKTSAGALLRIPVCRTSDWKEMLQFLQMNGIQVIGTSGESSVTIRDIDWTIPSAVVLGAEGEGLSHDTIKKADQLVKIPQTGDTESLNVSVACGITLYEASNQRVTAKDN